MGAQQQPSSGAGAGQQRYMLHPHGGAAGQFPGSAPGGAFMDDESNPAKRRRMMDDKAAEEQRNPPSFYLSPQQMQMLNFLQQNQGNLSEQQQGVLHQLQQQYALQQQHQQMLRQQALLRQVRTIIDTNRQKPGVRHLYVQGKFKNH